MLRSPEGDGRAAAVAGGEADGRARREGNGRAELRRAFVRRGEGEGSVAEELCGHPWRRGRKTTARELGSHCAGGSGEIESNRFSV